MFFYIYDEHAVAPTQAAALARVEARIIELGINGRVEKLGPLRNIKSLLDLAIKQKVHTVVVVGSDETLLRTVNILATADLVIGYIPFAEQSLLAKLLGIPDTFEACNILSRRITKTVDLGKANQNYFLTTARCGSLTGLRIRCNDAYTVATLQPTGTARIDVLGDLTQLATTPTGIEAQPGQLRVEITTETTPSSWLKRTAVSDHTSVTAERVVIDHDVEPIPVTLDGVTTLKTPLTITLKSKQLRLIVGKDRLLH